MGLQRVRRHWVTLTLTTPPLSEPTLNTQLLKKRTPKALTLPPSPKPKQVCCAVWATQWFSSFLFFALLLLLFLNLWNNSQFLKCAVQIACLIYSAHPETLEIITVGNSIFWENLDAKRMILPVLCGTLCPVGGWVGGESTSCSWWDDSRGSRVWAFSVLPETWDRCYSMFSKIWFTKHLTYSVI